MTSPSSPPRAVRPLDVRLAAVDIYLVQHTTAIASRGGGRVDWFGAELVRLFGKADAANVARLSRAFPAYGVAWACYLRAPSEEAFYRDLRIRPLLRSEGAAIYDAKYNRASTP